MASRSCQSPSICDMPAVDRIIFYLMGTSQLGLHLRSSEGIVLSATVDASYASHADRKSHSGFTLHIGSSSGSFLTKSKKQTVTADSSTVAELIAAFLASKEIAWARSILTELGYAQSHPTVFFEDNQSTIRSLIMTLIHKRPNTSMSVTITSAKRLHPRKLSCITAPRLK